MKLLFCNESTVVFKSMLPYKLKSQNKLPNCCRFYYASKLGKFIVHYMKDNPPAFHEQTLKHVRAAWELADSFSPFVLLSFLAP